METNSKLWQFMILSPYCLCLLIYIKFKTEGLN